MLLGCADGSKVSRYERFAREPTLATALACEALFGVPLRELFAGMYDEALDAVSARARSLTEQLDQKPGLHERKRQFLVAPLSNKSLLP